MLKKISIIIILLLTIFNLGWGYSILANTLTVDTRRVSTDSSIGIYDESGVSLQGNGSVTGDFVQIIDIGADGLINVPNMNDLSLTGDDVLFSVISPNIGYGYPATPNAGLFSYDINITNGKTIYLRAWNGSSSLNATYYGNSVTYNYTPPLDQDFYCGNFSTTINRDLTAPNSVTTLNAISAVQAANLSWIASSSTDNLGTLVVRSTSPITWTPSNYRTYSDYNYAGDYFDYSNRIITSNIYRLYTGSNLSFQDTGLTENTTYHYAAFAYDTAYNYAPAVTSSATATGGLEKAFEYFQAEASDAMVTLRWGSSTTNSFVGGTVEIWAVSSNSSSTQNYPTTANAPAMLVATASFGTGSTTHTGLINHKYYFYTIWGKKTDGTYSQSTNTYAKPETTSAYKAYNYPNPFSPGSGQSTALVFPLSAIGSYTLYLFNIVGQKVWSSSGSGVAGANTVVWDGSNAWGHTVPNGVYLLRVIQDGKVVANGKVSVLD